MYVNSDIEELHKVIVHRPDMGIEYITPEIAEQLLYDDIVFLPRIIEEHDIFTDSLKNFVGKDNVIEIEQLLEDIVSDEKVKQFIIKDVTSYHRLSLSKSEKLKSLQCNLLSEALISGLHPDTKEVLLPPLPNLVFTRDLGCVIHDVIVLCKAQKPARQRENILFSYIVRYHPLFKRFADKILDFTCDEYFCNSAISIEGGDIMMLGKGHLIVGKSERTTLAAIELLKNYLFDKNILDTVTVVELPEARYCMHLDTVFTLLHNEAAIGYAPLVFEENEELGVVTYRKGMHQPIFYPTLKHLLHDYSPEMQLIPCGNGIHPFDKREQWTDGCNVVAVRPGVAFSYERNIYTLKALKAKGYTTVSPKKIENLLQQNVLIEKLIVTIASSELSRARGGPHCMTLPISRG